jgi:ring-1,2-phenylacetyl-CoA epoxidase subunit PaaC
MSDDDEFDAYLSLKDVTGDDHRWAFGTGFGDPLAGIDVAVPAGADPAALSATCLALGDDALIYSHRLQQWVTRAPELEEETALANIALDLLGQARLLLTRAAQAEGSVTGKGDRDEDQLAFFRDERQFRNVRLVERADADFAELAVRLLVFSAWRLAVMRGLTAVPASDPRPDPVLAAIADKAVTELTYHRDYAAAWVIRLGDGTDYSHAKAQAALDTLWPLAAELGGDEEGSDHEGSDNEGWGAEADAYLDAVFAEATLRRPGTPPLAPVAGKTGRDGSHTEAMGYILAELQSVARANPEATW